MAKISKILRVENRQTYAKVIVQLDDGLEATVFVGGDVEVFLHGQTIKAVVKRAQSK